MHRYMVNALALGAVQSPHSRHLPCPPSPSPGVRLWVYIFLSLWIAKYIEESLTLAGEHGAGDGEQDDGLHDSTQ
jgi:hypothetical protein